VSGAVSLPLSECELVSLYVLLSRDEARLDSCQRDLLRRVSEALYNRLSVSQMEDIASYYETLCRAV
jgi:hypothetical protein